MPTILVVDDTPLILSVISEVLMMDGYHVNSAGNGTAAMAAVAAQTPDLILLDVRMADMDGIEVCRQLKADAVTREIPIILISGYAEVSEWVTGLQLGVADYLTKPFRPEELLTRVRIHLALRRADVSLAQQAALLRQTNEQLQAEIDKRQQVEDELRQSLEWATRSRHSMLNNLEDRKRAEAALVESEMMLNKAQEITHIGHFRFNPASGVVAGSDELFRIFGLARTKCQLSDFLGVVHPDQREFVAATMDEAIARASGYNIEHSLLFQDGAVKQVNAIGEIVTMETTGQSVLVGTIQDITQRKQAEEENTRLNAQLNQAQKMEAIGVLAGGIAHDFNNILGVIMGYADMAREDAQPGSRFTKDLDRVLTSAHRAKDLVKQILDFSRQARVEPMPLKIQPLIKESLKMLRASIPTTISIKESIPPHRGRVVLADPTQVQQIVMNLCTNAFQAMEKTGGVLSVGVKPVTIEASGALADRQIPPGEYVELVVGDTGSGIAPDIIGKIFDPFFSTKDIGKGTGMGLSITHGIISSYGGAITVDCTVGQGATFHVYFPVIQEEAKEAEEPQEAPMGQGRILFVDDEVLLAEMGKDMLERLGYTVTAHNHSIEAMDEFLEDPTKFDLVITDQTMPGLTGTDLARRMLTTRPDLPIILCTGFSHVIDEEAAKALGIKEFTFKPVTKASIGLLIRKLINKGEAG
jgi:PAS domain S-box-containing protein